MIGLNSQACRENFTFPFSLSSRKLQAEAANDFEGDKFLAFIASPLRTKLDEKLAVLNESRQSAGVV